MTGHLTLAGYLRPGDLICLGPHTAHDRAINSPALDVEVDGKPEQVTGHSVAVDWHQPGRYVGAQSTVTGRTVYESDDPVLVIGHQERAA
jgi:hypothetical protein